MFALVLCLSGCLSEPEPEGTWADVVESYNPRTCEFEGFDGQVVVEDVVESCEYIKEIGKTKVKLESKPEIPIYITKTEDHSNPSGGNFAPWYPPGDDIMFWIHIKEGKYGEYIVQMERK